MVPQATCARGLVAETLSAWRDRALGQSEMRDIEAHVRTCQRCQRLLTQFDIIGQALQRQRSPDLHDRVWREVQAGMTTRPHGGKRVAVLGGASAMVALLVVAILVFTALHTNHGTRPPLVATATATVYPTTTTIPMSAFTPAAQAWGVFPKQTMSYAMSRVYPTDVSTDGNGYLGLYNDGSQTPRSIVHVSVPGGGSEVLYTPAREESPTVLSDGRFVVWDGDYVYTGGSGGLPYQNVGYLDTQTGKVTTLIADQQGPIDDSAVHAADHLSFVWAPLTKKGEDLDVTNMVTGITTRIAAISVDRTVPGQELGLGTNLHMHLSWPYVFYTNTEQQHLYNISTGKDITLGQIKQGDFTFNDFALDGTTLFWLHTSFSNVKILQFDVLEHIEQPGASPKNLAAFSNAEILPDGKYGFVQGFNANSRLVVWNDGNGSYAWDRAQGRLVQIYTVPVQQPSSAPPSSTSTPTDIFLHGNKLLYTSGSDDGIPADTTIAFTLVDTSTLPTIAGA